MVGGYDKHPPEDPGTPKLGWWLSFLFMLLPIAFAYAVFVTMMGE